MASKIVPFRRPQTSPRPSYVDPRFAFVWSSFERLDDQALDFIHKLIEAQIAKRRPMVPA